jgi:hypothetical protein
MASEWKFSPLWNCQTGRFLVGFSRHHTTNTMQKITISTGFLVGNLLPESDGLDIDATVSAYADQLTAEIQAEFPEAEISVDWENAFGELPGPLKTVVCGDHLEFSEIEEIERTVDEIAERVFERGEFYITL